MQALIVMPEADMCGTAVAYLLAGAAIKSDHTEAHLAPEFLDRRPYDLVVLGMPGHDLEICAAFRAKRPDLALIAILDGPFTQRCALLSAGADDVIIRPFEPAELLARVAAVLRRSGRLIMGGRTINAGNITLDRDHSTVSTPWRKAIALTPTERLMVDYLLVHSGDPVKRENLASYVWGSPDLLDTSNCVDVYIRRLRKKIERNPKRPSLIVTIRGVGYKLVA